ncbi:hypothetical protein ACFSR7_36475 [Cohnella sp. GCM10020058]|uniref:hypothetical protein n=1 Tax=Cohnella sp. GCM10020058 TaxID=3317330 RepID=UPI00362E2BCF
MAIMEWLEQSIAAGSDTTLMELDKQYRETRLKISALIAEIQKGSSNSEHLVVLLENTVDEYMFTIGTASYRQGFIAGHEK